MRKKVFICSPFRGDMEGNARMRRMTLTRWKWMTRKIFLDKGTGAAGDCCPPSKISTQEGAMKWDES